jgi:predicted nucleic acid-binding protein
MAEAPTVFVDTAVLICADDIANPTQREQARAWLAALWQSRRGRVSTQVLNEYYVTVTRVLRPGLPQGDARAKLRRFQLWQPWQIDHQTIESAWGVEARFALSYWDALIVAAAAQSGCSHVLSLHLAHGMHIDAVQVVNPFLATYASLNPP